jgi:IclR family transcriptional regulator, acetate operon repressor
MVRTRSMENTGVSVPEPSGVEPGARNPVVRTLELLTWMASETPPWSIRSASRALDTSPASVHRLISVLEGRELVFRDELGRYYPGHELIRLAGAFSRQLSVKQLARPYLEQLASSTTEAALLAQFELHRPAMMFVDMIRSAHPITYITATYEWKPLHAGATGLTILAYLSETDLEYYFENASLTQLTSRTLIVPAAIRRELAAIVARGYGITKGQRTAGAVGLAAPIFDAQDHVAGSLCLTVPEQRFDPSKEAGFAEELVSRAADISRELKAAGLSGRAVRPGEPDEGPQ